MTEDNSPSSDHTDQDISSSSDAAEGDISDSPVAGRDTHIYGDQVHGDKFEGDKILGDKSVHVHHAEEAYDVRGLLNPYLGLSAFTYNERSRYAGRERTVAQAVNLLTTPGEQRTILFITGASSSGKSSFAQAGLLPALEKYYKQRNQTVRRAVFRPSRQPLASLADALLRLGLPATKTFAAVSNHILATPAEPASDNQISLLLMDQFEELFTQSVPDQRDKLFEILASFPGFSELRAHIVATLRSDYLPELFEHETLYDIAKQGIELRTMSIDELKLAIQRPLQQAYPQGEKRFEEALLAKLAVDTAEDAAYLPLLQVTLEDLWHRGSLQLSQFGNLTDAIQQRAEEVYKYTTTSEGQRIPRTEAEQESIQQIFLDLIEVSLDEDQRRDVRRQRPVANLVKDNDDEGSCNNPYIRKEIIS